MIKHIIPIAMLLMLAGTAFGTMWLYDDPMFFHGTQTQPASIKPAAGLSMLEFVDSAYFPLLGQGFYKDAIPVKLSNQTNTVQIGIKASSAMPPIQVTFSGGLENNMRYAKSKSTLRIGQQGNWNSLSAPGAQ
ncbi:Uncharacterised protein [uncultured archaeon]|nr:Uncharacterised protein [uncultured archaeon]